MAGCGGMLGEAFYKNFNSEYEIRCTDIDVNEKWLSFTDFRNYEEYFRDVEKFLPNYLFHIGAHTDLEYCELHQSDAYKTNTLAVENAVKISNKLNIPILYISTAGIFDGQKKSYDETDIPNPASHYAKTKYKSELYVKNYSKKYLICRAGWMMGAGPKKDKKFIQKIISQIKQGNKELFIVNDKTGTPTYTHDFAKNVQLLIERNIYGLYNMVCSGATTRLEVTSELLAILGLDNKIKITEVHSDYWKKDYYAPRPDCEILVNKNLDALKLNIMRNWKICLKEYIEESYTNYFS
jgi:dTDP-4-dehydrorhamnose reductase